MTFRTRTWVLATAVAVGVLSRSASLGGQTAGTMTPAGLAIQAATRAPLPTAILSAALADARPEMRLTAARIIGVTHALALTPPLIQALQREQHVESAVEQMRSLLLFRTPESVAAAFAYARQTRGKPLHVLASWLARTAPAQLAEQLTAFTGLDQPEEVLRLASRHWPAERQRLLRAWLRSIPAHWPRLLPLLLHTDTLDADVPVVLEALRVADEKTREATVWFILRRLAEKVPVPATVTDAVVVPGLPTTGTPTWEILGRELVARSQLKVTTPDRAEDLANQAPSHPRDFGSLRDLPTLTDAARDALRRRLGMNFRKRALPNRPEGLSMSDTPTMRAAPALYPGFLKSLLIESGCEWSRNERYAAATLTYGADGRPTRADLEQTSDGCRQALAGLVQVTLADESYRVREGTKEWLVVFLHDDVLACADLAETEEPRDLSMTQSFAPPHRTKMVRPAFPAAEVAARASGLVIIEGVLSRAGCLRTAAVTQSKGTYTFRDTSTMFALAALEAVLQWRFEPAQADGATTPVRFSIRVSFTPR